MTTTYDLTTARAICNDAIKDTWEVQAQGADGQWWTVSDSSQMSQEDAESMAADVRASA